MLAFAIGSPGEVLQLTGAIVRIRPKGGEARTIRVPHAEMSMAGYAPLHGDLYLVKENPAVLAFPAGDLVDFTGTVDVDIFFSVIPTGGGA
jgi:hypothetical protein